MSNFKIQGINIKKKENLIRATKMIPALPVMPPTESWSHGWHAERRLELVAKPWEAFLFPLKWIPLLESTLRFHKSEDVTSCCWPADLKWQIQGFSRISRDSAAASDNSWCLPKFLFRQQPSCRTVYWKNENFPRIITRKRM